MSKPQYYVIINVHRHEEDHTIDQKTQTEIFSDLAHHFYGAYEAMSKGDDLGNRGILSIHALNAPAITEEAISAAFSTLGKGFVTVTEYPELQDPFNASAPVTRRLTVVV